MSYLTPSQASFKQIVPYLRSVVFHHNENIHWSSITLWPLTGKVSSTSHPDPMQCSAGKPRILGLTWISLGHVPKHFCRPITPHSHTVGQHHSLMSSFLQRDISEPYKNSIWRAQKHVKEPEVFPWPLNSPDTTLMGSDNTHGKQAQYTKTLPTTHRAQRILC